MKTTFAREARFLAHIAEEQRLIAEWEHQISDSDSKALFTERRNNLTSFREAVADLLPEGLEPPARLPTLKEMMTSIGGERLYVLYRQLSQYIHGGHSATWVFRSGGVGTHKVFGNFAKVADWVWPLYAVFLALTHPARVVLTKLGADPTRYLSESEEEELRRVLVGGA